MHVVQKFNAFKKGKPLHMFVWSPYERGCVVANILPFLVRSELSPMAAVLKPGKCLLSCLAQSLHKINQS